ncbi:MAG: hypothetical protein V1745_00140 [Patescibacteria group bacterium]
MSALIVLGGLAFVWALSHAPSGGRQAVPWALAIVCIALVAGVISRIQYGLYRRRVSREKALLREGDLLYQRARLIAKAEEHHRLHLDRFQAWEKAVSSGISKSDEAFVRYGAFVAQAGEVLSRATNEFFAVAAVEEASAAFEEEFGEAADDLSNGALNELMQQEGQTVDIPRVRLEVDVASYLEDEEVTNEIEEALKGDDLAERIDNLPLKT